MMKAFLEQTNNSTSLLVESNLPKACKNDELEL